MARSLGLIFVIALSCLHKTTGQFFNLSSLYSKGEVSPTQYILSRLPYISNLKELQNLLGVFGSNGTVREKPNFRSKTDDNSFLYNGAQIWTVKINGTKTEEVEKLITEMVSSEHFLGVDLSVGDGAEMFAAALYPQLGLAFILLVKIDCLIPPSYYVVTGLDVSLIRMYSPHGQQGKQEHPSAYPSSTSTPRYRGYQLWKVHETDLQNTTLRHFLTKYGAELWNINQDGIDVLITKTNAKAAKNYIDSTNFTFNVMISDVEAAIDETYLEVNNTELTNTPWLEREGTLMDWNRYHDLGDITDFLNYCLETYPDIVQIITIGRTYNKRNIEVLRISNGNRRNRAVFVSSGLQGRDWISPAAVTFAISKLLWLWDHSSNFQSIDWYFLPVANPDGFQYSWLTDRLWAKNRRHFGKCYGTHIDRNFGYNWGGGGGSDNECKNLYRGPQPFSEQETKSIRQFLRNISPKLDAFITIGAYGQVITYPWGDADYVTNNRNDLHKVAKRARLNVRKLNAAEYMIGSSYRLKLEQSGNIADWVQHDVSPRYVYSVYLKDQGRYGYLLPPDYIVESGEEAYEIIKTISSGVAKEEPIYGRRANYI